MIGRRDEGNAEADLAVSIDPNHAYAYGIQGMARLFAGQFSEAIEALKTAMRLSPFDPISPLWTFWLGRAHYGRREYDTAMTVSRHLYEARPDLPPNIRTLIAALGQLGRTAEAQQIIREARLRLGEHLMPAGRDQIGEGLPDAYDHLAEGWRKAGLI
jgi:tetratricopeptide (TPR) repeat protein